MSNGINSRSDSEIDLKLEVPPDLAADPRWQLALRICHSRTFAKSKRPRELLVYLASNLLAGRTDEVSEFEISRRVFGRGGGSFPQKTASCAARHVSSG